MLCNFWCLYLRAVCLHVENFAAYSWKIFACISQYLLHLVLVSRSILYSIGCSVGQSVSLWNKISMDNSDWPQVRSSPASTSALIIRHVSTKPNKDWFEYNSVHSLWCLFWVLQCIHYLFNAYWYSDISPLRKRIHLTFCVPLFSTIHLVVLNTLQTLKQTM